MQRPCQRGDSMPLRRFGFLTLCARVARICARSTITGTRRARASACTHKRAEMSAFGGKADVASECRFRAFLTLGGPEPSSKSSYHLSSLARVLLQDAAPKEGRVIGSNSRMYAASAVQKLWA